MRIGESVENAMAKQATGAEQRLINVGGGAVDGADNLEAEKIGQETIGEIQVNENSRCRCSLHKYYRPI